MEEKNKIKNKFSDISFGGVNTKAKILFADNLSTMLRSGMTLTEALGIIEDQVSGKMKNIVYSISESVSSGNSFHESLSVFPKVFSPFFINTVMVGESSGNLDNNLKNIAEELKREKDFWDTVRGAMLYPLIILILSFFLGIILSFFVLPKIIPIFEGLKVDLPMSTRFLMWLSALIENYGGQVFLALIFFVGFLIWLFRQRFFHPISHFVFLYIPVVGNLSRKKNISQFARVLGSLLKSGLTIDMALDICGKTVRNFYYQKSIFRIAESIQRGDSLFENLKKERKYFPKMFISIIRVGESSGKLEEELFNLEKFYEQEVKDITKKITVIIEPVLLIVIGSIVAWLAISIITPIYKVTGRIR